MRALFLLAVLVTLSPIAAAQTHGVPIQGNYEDVYVIIGRALDSRGLPVSGGRLTIELEQEGVRAEPLAATANCKGDFITSFTLRQVDPKGRAKVTLHGAAGQDVTTTVALDPFYRRSDALLRLDAPWQQVCAKEQNVWEVSASLSTRLLNRTEPYMDEEVEFHARPYTGIVRLRFETPGGNTVCPPHPQDPDPAACELFVTDPRGDLRYTFTLDQPFDAGGRVEIILQDGSSLHVPVDPASRIGVKYFEVTGRGVPEELYETPAAGVGLLVAAALVAMALTSRRR